MPQRRTPRDRSRRAALHDAAAGLWPDESPPSYPHPKAPQSDTSAPQAAEEAR